MIKDKTQTLVHVSCGPNTYCIGIASSKREAEELAVKMILRSFSMNAVWDESIKKIQNKRKFRDAINKARDEKEIHTNFYPIERSNSIIMDMV